jgi:hypothetical protein
MWDVGAEYLRPLGRKIIENQRRANGDTRSLDLAPAQFLGEDESLDLQVFLMTVLGNGWSGCFVPDGANFVVEFRSSHRLFFYCESEAALNRLKLELEVFEPQPDAGAESKWVQSAAHFHRRSCFLNAERCFAESADAHA